VSCLCHGGPRQAPLHARPACRPSHGIPPTPTHTPTHTGAEPLASLALSNDHPFLLCLSVWNWLGKTSVIYLWEHIRCTCHVKSCPSILNPTVSYLPLLAQSRVKMVESNSGGCFFFQNIQSSKEHYICMDSRDLRACLFTPRLYNLD
jgi:hypothetical protein